MFYYPGIHFKHRNRDIVMRYYPRPGLKSAGVLSDCPHMPLIKLNRINKGGEIVIGSEHIVYVEVDARTTTIHMVGGLLFSVVESLDAVTEVVENVEAARRKQAA